MKQLLMPKKIIKSSEVVNSKNLFTKKPIQPILRSDNEFNDAITTINAKGFIVLDFGKEMNGGIRIITNSFSNNNTSMVRIRFGESLSETNKVFSSSVFEALRGFNALRSQYYFLNKVPMGNERKLNQQEIQKYITKCKEDSDIVFEAKNLRFSYDDKTEVLHGLDFKIKKGETIALVGESGGGKTTICHLIPNFYKVNEGEILIDDININDLSFKTLRQSIGIVQQDVFLFNGTIKENILYGRLDASEEEVIEASKRANIYDYIMTLPDGFDTQIGERGVKLSGGQKQRLSIARVFLKNPPILILDEATSALDNTTEILIQGALNELAKGRTTIVVAHRLSTIKNANRILVVTSGKIEEEGTHEELLNKKGIYEKLYHLQFRDGLLD